MAIAHVQEVGGVAGNQTASLSITPTTATTLGNTILVGVAFYPPSGTYPTAAITDSKGNTYTVLYTFVGSATTGPSMVIAAAFNATSVPTSGFIRATFTGTAPFSILGVDEYSGVSSTQDSTTASGSGGSGTSVAFSGLTTSNANDLVLCYVSSFGNLAATSWSSPWSTNKEFKSSGPTLSWTYQVVSSTATYSGTATLGTAEFWNYALLALEAASGAVSASVSQVSANVTAAGGTQSIATVNDATVSQSAAVLTATGGAPTLGIALTQAAANVVSTGGSQTVVSIQTTNVAQTAASVTANTGMQVIAVIQDATVGQAAAIITAAGGVQVITTSSVVNGSVTQVAANVTATGGTQTVASVQNASINQVAANLTASAGSQVIATVNDVAISQSAASVTATGGTHTVQTVQDVQLTQTGAVITLAGGTQVITAIQDASISQSAANVSAAGGTQSVSASSGLVNASVTQSGASVTAAGGVQIITISTSPLPPRRPPSPIFLVDGRMAVSMGGSLYLPL